MKQIVLEMSVLSQIAMQMGMLCKLLSAVCKLSNFAYSHLRLFMPPITEISYSAHCRSFCMRVEIMVELLEIFLGIAFTDIV